jgi:glycosyltransferase involved in cell wall biosynthesis
MTAASRYDFDWVRGCAAVVPCFNEGSTVSEVVRGIRKHVPTVFVMDDGSTDDTAARSDDAGATVIRNTGNRGKGSALRTGLNHARTQGFAWALTLDGDGQHAATDIPNFFACAGKTHAALIVGNRLNAPGKMPLLRRMVNRLMTKLLSRLAGTPLADSQCGFRLIDLEAWAKLPLKTDHFETESELLVEFIRAGHRVEFVPVQAIYKSGRSKIRPLVDTWRWLRWWIGQW